MSARLDCSAGRAHWNGKQMKVLRLLGVVWAVTLGGCVYTAPFRGADGDVLPGSIATMEMLPINGVRQSVWFRAADVRKPALVIVHGGPGISESALFRHYDAALERHFLVVYWEQRGAGRSYHADIPPASMTIAQFVRDLDAVVDHVRHRFGKDKVVVLAHSWGTVPGVMYAAEHAEKVAAYVGVAQIANVARGLELEYAFDFAEATRRHDEAALATLQKIGNPPYDVDAILTLGSLTQGFSGDVSTGRLILAALSTDEANLLDLIRFGQGNRFSLDHLWPELSRVELTQTYRRFELPIFFFLGRRDWHVPSVLAAHWFAHIRAPVKSLVWFDESAHNPPFQQPAAFQRVLVEALCGIVERGCIDP